MNSIIFLIIELRLKKFQMSATFKAIRIFRISSRSASEYFNLAPIR